MITSKQRAFLRSMANKLQPVIQVGKEGVTDKFIKQLEIELESHELVKVNVLENSGLTSKEAGIEAAEKTGSEFVQSIGRKFTLYREASEEPSIQLPK